MKSKVYQLTKDVSLPGGEALIAGTYVHPIYHKYLPKHITDETQFYWFNPILEVYCYTNIGIMLLNRNIIEEV